ncbi:hypothetical protein HanXRQr2_Chr15g0673801 [Helianthus annuus]|uniref:Uncharacterized protein n=1 Tax=Helianthus annuus TaxID=4232 RepID=A0A9K3H304_HELAN|nr:hypothetical protein HanXRQr2_Chr15g0673801 [Helianthus annuus]KAJ0829692.1 hypothetical protein HanPSC8_Chr15g0646661 [Helianthus annuus]
MNYGLETRSIAGDFKSVARDRRNSPEQVEDLTPFGIPLIYLLPNDSLLIIH